MLLMNICDGTMSCCVDFAVADDDNNDHDDDENL